MQTNLIQNYTSNTSVQKYKDPKDFNIREVLANKTFIKPLPGKGKLVESNLFNAPGIMVNDLIYDFKSLKHGIKGKANDHELGKLNDVGLKLGALAIGGYLFTKKFTPKTKWMEFVGPATFIASMSLWPKIAIQFPAKLIHGVNVRKEYEDSFGRKKPFTQDPQFIPWDAYSDKQINKIGNWLGVPKDIPNRREFIQEKMRKIAVQNNTLWMLTAGFATPVMSALMCNAIEPHLLKYQNKHLNANAAKMLDNMPKYAEELKDTTNIKKIETLIKIYKDKPVSRELFNDIASYITDGFDPITSKAIKQDLDTILMSEKFHIDKSTVNNLIKNVRETLAVKIDREHIKNILPTADELINEIKENNSFDKTLDNNRLKKLGTSISTMFSEKINKFVKNNPDVKIDIRSNVVRQAIGTDSIIKSLKNNPAIILDKTYQSFIRNIVKIMSDFNAKFAVTQKYAFMKTAAAPETDYAYFANKMDDTLVKVLNLSDKDLKELRINPAKSAKILRTHLEKITSNEAEYNRVLTEFCEQLSTVPKVDFVKYKELNESIFHELSTKLKDLNMPNAVRALIGENGDTTGSLLKIVNEFPEYRMANTSTYYRFLNLLDFMRKISTQTNLKSLEGVPKEIMEEHIESALKNIIDGHAADFSVKNPMKRNPNPNVNDFSGITTENGIFNPQYVNAEKEAVELADNGGHFYRRTMNLSYTDELHPETTAVCEKYSQLESLKHHRKEMIEKIGNNIYDYKLSHTYERPMHAVFDGGRIFELKAAASNDKNFQLLGKAPSDWLSDAGRQAFNTKKWLKMFGKIGAGLLAATVLIQFTFGRMKTPNRRNTGVNRNA